MMGNIAGYTFLTTDDGFFGRRFFGRRRLTKRSSEDYRNLVSDGLSPLNTSRSSAAAWASSIYQLRFGDSNPDSGFTLADMTALNWSNYTTDEWAMGANADRHGFDAAAFFNSSSNQAVVAIEGSTSTGDWIVDAAIELSNSTDHFNAARDYALELVNQLNSNGVTAGSNVLVTGQSLGAATVPIVTAVLEDAGYVVSAQQFSTPGFRDELIAYFSDPTVAQSIWGTQNASVIQAEINALEASVSSFAFANDAILLTGQYFGQFANGSANSNAVTGPTLYLEQTVIENGIATQRFTEDGVHSHSARLIAEVLLSTGNAISGGFVLLDRFGRLMVYQPTGQLDPSEIVDFENNILPDLKDPNSEIGVFLRVSVPEDSVLTSGRTFNDGTVSVEFTTGDGQRVSLNMKELADGSVISVQRTLGEDGTELSSVIQRDGLKLEGQAAENAMGLLLQNSTEFAPFMAAIGSSLGGYLGRGDAVLETVSSAALGAVALNIGQALDQAVGSGTVYGYTVAEQSADGFFNDFSSELLSQMRGATAGTISSYLSMELAEGLGLTGFGRDLFNTVSNSVLSQVLDNAIALNGQIFSGITTANAFGNVANVSSGGGVTWHTGFLASAVGSFFGARLGEQVVTPQTEAAAMLSTVGSAVGTLAFSSAGASFAGSIGTFAASLAGQLGTLGNFVVPGLGSFIGFVLGSLIGNLFGKKKPAVPTADAETVLNFNTGYYQVGAVNSANGGNEDLVRNMSETARDTLNGLIGVITYGSEIAGNANLVSPTQTYGHTGGQIWVQLGTSSTKTNFQSADEAVDFGSLWAIRQTKVAGGDLFFKRAIYNNYEVNSVTALAGSLQLAQDFSFYLDNRDVIDASITEPFDSLSQADKNFYNANSHLDTSTVQNSNQSRISRILAAPRDANGNIVNDGSSISLNSSDLSWYNSNKTTVDRIVGGLELTQFASGWIVTLQRAAELGLNDTSKSDFFGGMAGFADSLKLLANSDFKYEDVQLDLNGSTLQVDYGRSHDPMENVLRGGDLSLGTDPLVLVGDSGGGASESIERLDDGTTAMVFRDTGAFATWGSGTLNAAYYEFHGGDIENGRAYSVNPGDQMSIGFESKRLGNTLNRLFMYAFFYRSDGSYISNVGRWDGTSTEWTTNQRSFTVPAEAATARIRIYTYARSGSAGGTPTTLDLAGRNFHVNISDSPFPSTPTYSAPVYERWNAENFLSGGGYNQINGTAATSVSASGQSALITQAGAAGHENIQPISYTLISTTNQDNTSGNDYFEHTGSSGVVLDDQRVESADFLYSHINTSDGSLELAGASITHTLEGGDDIFLGGAGDDTLRGRSGFDWLNGGDGEDTIYGGDDDDVILGGDGSDRLYGENGDDYIHLGDGHNYYKDVNGVWTAYGAWGGNGNDTIVASGTSVYAYGQNDDDTIVLTESVTGWSRYSGGAGVDTLSFERYTTAINLNIGTLVDGGGGAGWQTFNSHEHFTEFENFTATEFDDTLTGDSSNNVLRGLGGDDTLNGGGASDVLEGGSGADHLIGGGGWDTASYENSNFAVWIDWTEGEAFGGDAEGDTFDGVHHAFGSQFDDTFKGTSATNHFHGKRGDDWFVATSGWDNFFGDEDFDTVDYSEFSFGVTVNLASGLGTIGSQSHAYDSIEHVVGSDHWDTLTGGSEDNVFQGGKGNDILRGGAGLDTYIFHDGDGQDKISESLSNGGWDTLMFGDGIGWSDLQYSGGTNIGSISGETNSSNLADMRFTIRGTSHRVDVYDNWTGIPDNGNREAKIDAIDVGGVGAVDIEHIEGGAFGTDTNNTIYGDSGWNRADIIFGYAGNDTIYAAGSDLYDNKKNVIIAGRGNDTIRSSTGDDQYVFERGDGADTIYDTGGADRIQFGSDVAAEDIIFEIVGTSLYIGIRDLSDPTLSASQVADRIRVMDISQTQQDTVIEYITAAGVDIDLRKLDLWNLGSQSGGGGGSSPPPPPPPPPGNNAPNAVDDIGFVTLFSLTNISLLANDTDPDGHSLTVDQINGQSVTIGSTITTAAGNSVQLNGGGVANFTSTGVPGVSDSFTYRVSDGNGGYDTATVNVSIFDPGGGGFLFPIVVDLDGDGADMISVNQSRVVFENDGGGPLWRTGWVGADDGLLALDRDGDGTINRLSEISFVSDYEGATTDLEGLRGFDSNEDGVFDVGDERWGDFLIWQDANQNGVGTSGELMSLEEAGITSISLGLTDLGNELQGNRDSVILNEAAVMFADGTETSAFDVALNIQLAHIRGTSLENFDDLFDGVTWEPDGAFGVAHYGRRNNPKRLREFEGWDENVTAALQTEEGLQGPERRRARNLPLLRYVDEDDSMTAAPDWQPDPNDPVTQSYGVKPLVIDMDGDGLELINPMYSPMEIDGNGDGVYDRMGWISTDDAFLALDRDGDGQISAPNEISFVQDLPGAQTDLDGLAAYDSNGDGWFDSSDDRFGDFTVWQDLDFDGVSSSNELTSLVDVGITRIGLTRAEGTYSSDGPLGNTVFGEAAVVWSDGREGIIGDVELRAFNGDLAEQRLTEALRSQRQRVSLGAWDFDRDARRAVIDEFRTDDFTGFDAFPALEASGGNGSPFALSQREGDSGQVSNRFDVLKDRPQTNYQPTGKEDFARAQGATAETGSLFDEAILSAPRSDRSSTWRERRRWWSQRQEERFEAAQIVSLKDLLAGFDAARDQFSQQTSQSTLPQESAEALAERQRFLQAVASFRGSSGIATPRRRSDGAYSEDVMIGASSILRNGAHSMTVA